VKHHNRPRVRRSVVAGQRAVGWLGVLLLTGCASATVDTGLAAGSPAGCPAAVGRLLGTGPAPTELDLVVDGSGSYLRPGEASQAYVLQQVDAAVDRAIEQHAALRVLVFAGSAGDVASVVACPALVPRVRNEAARPARTSQLRETTRREVRREVLAGRPAMAKPGTSVVGGFVALGDVAPLAPPPAARTAVMLTDGVALPESGDSVDLSGFAEVGMYGVGHTTKPLTTAKVERLRSHWQAWLEAHQSHRSRVSSQPYSGWLHPPPPPPSEEN
jgi:hypothetical protein